jgi:hypothetical protein
MDEASALLLADNYPRSRAIYAIFRQPDIAQAMTNSQSFFNMAEKLEALPLPWRSIRSGASSTRSHGCYVGLSRRYGDAAALRPWGFCRVV